MGVGGPRVREGYTKGILSLRLIDIQGTETKKEEVEAVEGEMVSSVRVQKELPFFASFSFKFLILFASFFTESRKQPKTLLEHIFLDSFFERRVLENGGSAARPCHSRLSSNSTFQLSTFTLTSFPASLLFSYLSLVSDPSRPNAVIFSTFHQVSIFFLS